MNKIEIISIKSIEPISKKNNKKKIDHTIKIISSNDEKITLNFD